MKYAWDRFLEEGASMFNYMISNYEKMFEINNTITHFNIRSGTYHIDDSILVFIKEQYLVDIQSELVSWIQREYESTSLLEYTNWKPFRDQYTLIDMYFGYRKMFVYKHYYFQLALDSYCRECSYYKNTNERTHFKLALYGWKDEHCEHLQPDDVVSIPHDNIMPMLYWEES